MGPQTVYGSDSNNNVKGYISRKRKFLEVEEIVEAYIEKNIETDHQDLIKQILLHHETLIENDYLRNILKDFTKFKKNFHTSKRSNILQKNCMQENLFGQNETGILFTTFLIREMRLNFVSIQLHVPSRSVQENKLNILIEVLRHTETRSRILNMANSIKISILTDVALYKLFEELVQGEDVAWKQVLIVFFFSADLIIRSFRQNNPNTCCLLKWSLHYFQTTLTDFISIKGGWDIILAEKDNFNQLSIYCACFGMVGLIYLIVLG